MSFRTLQAGPSWRAGLVCRNAVSGHFRNLWRRKAPGGFLEKESKRIPVESSTFDTITDTAVYCGILETCKHEEAQDYRNGQLPISFNYFVHEID
ncbi:hypothetical protein CEXT_419701 [Caerostris extrusa]|uniref:Uncharacterized protein n=1 Tax=Caerostris extrusa TaxID=172846 RepID=A0AAV4W8Q3_CAEEX|nr:hypothetical protein CEXT_419701 [Caerostris extrusa]